MEAAVLPRSVEFSRFTPKPWGHEVLFTAPDLPYTGKILFVLAGQRLSLQIHDEKIETMFLLSGEAVLQLEDEHGALESISMREGVGYTVFPGRRHRLVAVTDTAVAEASTPEVGTTFRIEDDFGRPDERLS